MYNHYIPQFYLKRWTEYKKKGSRLARYSRPYHEIVVDKKPTSSVGGQDNLYRIPHVTDGSEYSLEIEFFGKIDQNASLVMNKMEEQGVAALSSEERTQWASFLISLRQRRPERLIQLGDQIEIFFHSNLERYRAIYQRTRRSTDPPNFDDFVSAYSTKERIAQARIMLLREAIEIPNSTRVISNSMWKVKTVGGDQAELLTSDNPLFIDGSKASDGGYLTLPLSPTTLFVVSMNVGLLSADVSSLDVNDIIVRSAFKEVYGTNILQKSFVEDRLRRLAIKEEILQKIADRKKR